MKVVRVRQLLSNPLHYSVNISVGGLLINGILYLSESRSLQMPRNQRGTIVVRMRGMQCLRLRQQVEEWIESNPLV